eukprot:scaffold17142_cov131-Isochrysis_galbana.AAC.3
MLVMGMDPIIICSSWLSACRAVWTCRIPRTRLTSSIKKGWSTLTLACKTGSPQGLYKRGPFIVPLASPRRRRLPPRSDVGR